MRFVFVRLATSRVKTYRFCCQSGLLHFDIHMCIQPASCQQPASQAGSQPAASHPNSNCEKSTCQVIPVTNSSKLRLIDSCIVCARPQKSKKFSRTSEISFEHFVSSCKIYTFLQLLPETTKTHVVNTYITCAGQEHICHSQARGFPGIPAVGARGLCGLEVVFLASLLERPRYYCGSGGLFAASK